MYEDCPVTEETPDECLMSFASTDDTGALLDWKILLLFIAVFFIFFFMLI